MKFDCIYSNAARAFWTDEAQTEGCAIGLKTAEKGALLDTPSFRERQK